MPMRENVGAVSTMAKRTYIDANLLIAAWHGRDEAGIGALTVLDDRDRTLLVSDALWLEVGSSISPQTTPNRSYRNPVLRTGGAGPATERLGRLDTGAARRHPVRRDRVIIRAAS